MSYDKQLSAHFNEREFVCKCGGSFKECPRLVLDVRLVIALEKYRAKFSPEGVRIVSGFRCTGYNTKVGGAKNSQHLYGTAVDILPKVSLTNIRSLSVFSGIGIVQRSGLVVHLDIRHLGPHNSKGANTKLSASPSNPAVWFYY